MAGGENFFSSFVCCSTRQEHDGHNHSFFYRQQGPVPASHTPKPSLLTHDQKAKKANDHKKPMSEVQKQATNDGFSAYIKRTKMKIRTRTNLGGWNRSASNSNLDDVHVHVAKNEDHTRDIFSEYINRVKIKIRKTTTGFGSSRKSFKGEHARETG